MSGTGEGTSAMEGGDSKQNGAGQRQGMLSVNDLNYVLAPDLSVSVNNTYKNHYFQSATYTETQRGICILNSGADYADTRSSTLNFSIQVTTPASFTTLAYFGKNGSILNIIKNITISSRSGDEISRVTDLNHLCQVTNGFKYSKNWVESVGGSIGYGGCLMPADSTSTELLHTFSIPLYLLSDFFAYGRLMPAMVLAGLRIEIEWEAPSIAFQSVDAATDATLTANYITNYTITNPYIALRSVQLTDGTQRALNEMSAVNGLEIVYCDHERTEATYASGKGFNLEVRKAASRALKAHLTVRTGGVSVPSVVDSFRTEGFDYKEWQWQLGALYFPQQPVKARNGTPREAIAESYNHTLVAFNTFKVDQNRCSAIPLRDSSHFLEQNIARDTGRMKGHVTSISTSGVVAGDAAARFSTETKAGDKVCIGGVVYNVDEASAANAMKVSPFPTATVTGVFDLARVTSSSGVGGNSYGKVTSNTPWAQERQLRTGQFDVNQQGRDGTFANGRTTISCLLERSDLFNLTGVPINNARVLNCQATFEADRARKATIFLKYVRLARVFLNNVEVEQ